MAKAKEAEVIKIPVGSIQFKLRLLEKKAFEVLRSVREVQDCLDELEEQEFARMYAEEEGAAAPH